MLSAPKSQELSTTKMKSVREFNPFEEENKEYLSQKNKEY